MLTKDLLRYRTLKDKVFPQFIDEQAPYFQELAEQIVAVAQTCVGQRLCELKESMEPFCGDLIGKGLGKLVSDLVETACDETSIRELRWQIWQAAKKRFEQSPDVEAFYAAVARDLGKPIPEVQEVMYNDLPELQVISEWREIRTDQLLQKYNLAQVQGLLFFAEELKVNLKSLDLGAKRALVRDLKFHRLLAEIKTNPHHADQLSLEISGPLSLFEKTQSYGIRLAKFFPCLLRASQWEIQARINMRGRKLILQLDQKSNLKSHYKSHDSFVPEELTSCLSLFNENSEEWQAFPNEEFLNLGNERYSFPDITLKNKRDTIHIELFHRWHQNQLIDRMEVLSQEREGALYLGVTKTIADKVKALMISHHKAGERVFSFNDFPSARFFRQIIENFEQRMPQDDAHATDH